VIAVVLTVVFPDPVNVKLLFVPVIPPLRVRVFAEDPIVAAPERLIPPLSMFEPETFNKAPVPETPDPVIFKAFKKPAP
jgi:hypothetical protein